MSNILRLEAHSDTQKGRIVTKGIERVQAIVYFGDKRIACYLEVVWPKGRPQPKIRLGGIEILSCNQPNVTIKGCLPKRTKGK